MLAAALLWAASPSSVRAASFSSSVTFPGDEEAPIVWQDDVEDAVYKWAGCGGDMNVSVTQAHSPTHAYRSSAGDPTCYLQYTYAVPAPGETYTVSWWGSYFGGGVNTRQQEFGFCGSGFGGTQWLATIGSPFTPPTSSWGSTSKTGTAPGGTVGFCYRGISSDNMYVDDIVITGAAQESPECLGEGELAWGNPDLTTTHPWYGDGGRYSWMEPAGWGDFYFPDMGEGTPACQRLFGQASYVYQFPTVPAIGDAFHLLTSHWCSSDTTACGVNMYWVNAAGGRIPQGEHSGTPPGSVGYVHSSYVLQNAPDGAPPFTHGTYQEVLVEGVTGIEIEASGDMYLVQVAVANVQGTDQDPEDPDFSCPPDTWCGPGGGPSLQDCEPPVDPLDVAGWVSYLACIVSNGFVLILSAIEGVFDTVTAAIGGLLEELFIPTTVGDDWDDFQALFGTKVPFAWASEAVSFLQGMLTSGNLAGGSFPVSFSLMGAPVAVDVSAVFSPLAPFRGIFAGLVYIAGGWAIFRAVGRALGYGASE
jgi:hypothetical protein